jgi:uncharacterized protein (TIRG00374 family)
VRAGKALRLLAAIVLLGISLWWAHPAKVWDAARTADWTWIGSALLLVAADRTLMAYRSIALLTPILRAERPPIRALLRVFFVSTYLGTFLPGSVGGDAVRTIALNRLDVPAADAFASVFVDRFLGILSNLVMAVAGLILARELASDPLVLAGLLGTSAICIAAAALVFSRHAAAAGTGFANRLPGSRAGRLTSKALNGLRQYAGERRVMAVVFAASVAVQVLRLLQAYCLGRALGIDLPVSAYFAFIPTILIVILLPLSISGLGTSQLAFVALFSRAGVDRADAFTLSVLFLGLGVVGNLPGGVLYAFSPREEVRQT